MSGGGGGGGGEGSGTGLQTRRGLKKSVPKLDAGCFNRSQEWYICDTYHACNRTRAHTVEHRFILSLGGRYSEAPVDGVREGAKTLPLAMPQLACTADQKPSILAMSSEEMGLCREMEVHAGEAGGNDREEEEEEGSGSGSESESDQSLGVTMSLSHGGSTFKLVFIDPKSKTLVDSQVFFFRFAGLFFRFAGLSPQLPGRYPLSALLISPLAWSTPHSLQLVACLCACVCVCVCARARARVCVPCS